MNRVTATILSLALAASVGWAADPPEKKEVPLPVPVVKAEEAMETAVNKALAIYLKTVEAEVKKMHATLEKEKAAATRAGNLELALAIKAKQDALTVDAVVTNAAGRGADLLGESGKVDLAKMIVGKWNWTGREFEFGPGGKIIGFRGDWKIVKNTIVVNTAGVDHIFTVVDNNNMSGIRSNDNVSFTISKKE
jgi:hypothetical protein